MQFETLISTACDVNMNVCFNAYVCMYVRMYILHLYPAWDTYVIFAILLFQLTLN